jgi:ferritin
MHLDEETQQMRNIYENEGGEEGKLGLEICDKKKRIQERSNPSSVMVNELKEDMKEFYDSKCGTKRCMEFKRC